MDNTNIKYQEEGKCPVCGSSSLNYGDSQLEGDGYYYNVHCDDCDLNYKEWYDLTFSEVTIS